MSKIAKIEARSFKRLTEVTIDAGDTVITIGGQNAQGKSSVLDAIAAALGGEKLCPQEPIHRGETTALARVTLDDGLVAERRWEKLKDGRVKTKLEVRDPTGRTLPGPQGVLDKLLGRLSFDPEAFARAEPKKQLELLRAVTGVNLQVLDAKRSDLFSARTEVNRELKAAENAVFDLADIPTPEAQIDVAELLERQKAAGAAAAEMRELQWQVEKRDREVKGWAEQVADLKAKLQTAESMLVDSQSAWASAAADLELADAVPDVTTIDAQILAAQAHNEECSARARKLEERKKRHALQIELENQAADLSGRIADIDAEKEHAVAAAKFPVPDLGSGEDGVTYRGIPLEQASSAEKLRVSMAMGLALNPELRVVQIRNASLLDDTSLALVEEMAAAADAQVWLEVVGRRGAGIVIADGEVETREVAA